MLAIDVKTTDVRARIEPALKEDAQRVLAENGLTLSDAVRLFLRQVVLTRGLPFEVRIPNETTLEALHESRAMKGSARLGSAQELFDELEKKGKTAAKK
ncbi:type II toxin-antitoxin system RelB/DinJ family antitoxin [Cupriavidus pauculus]|uniref:Type II toxin-antitoxin system RelB/DinJ family antitoxin n=1 Tax=Cupriavidus pauculus TaxID=82633 RepID=A0A5P2H7R3_9BURK|nr:type II toxin-antitoxin system RelB/DinJ family antitoxin [Cupriavidus pauculus]QET04131.1 type II toxin-antitoxin system RelB/DinJ family antitoxin [Cupriavidus pauculus]